VTDGPFLSRWSRRKSASRAGAAGPTADAVPAQAASTAGTAGPTADAVRPQVASTAGTAGPTADAVPAQAGIQSQRLPPIESLTPDSDFAEFMKPGVDPSLKRDAFKKLIEDPRFNVMDGLDVYIDDYSKPDPLPEGWLEKMSQVRYLGIFKDDEEKAEDAQDAQAAQDAENTETAASTEPQSLPDAPVSFPPQAVPADTSIDQIPPAEVGKSGGMKGGS
jgi:Protein of unknown function (DUF3306)